MKPQTKEEAEKRFCPFTFSTPPASRCLVENCMAWRVVYQKCRREDHSDASLDIAVLGSRTNRTPRREGGYGSSGFWVLDEVGVCARLGGKESEQ